MKTAGAGPIRVMIVEDSGVVRQLLAHIVSRDPRLAVVAALASAEEALRELNRVQPDVISMDIRLPGMDGLEATRRIMAERPTPIVVVAGSVEDDALRISLNAIKAGALTVVEKPVGLETAGYEQIAETICTQLYIMSQVSVIRRRIGEPRQPAPTPELRERPTLQHRPTLVAMAASTGGPPALAKVIASLPAGFPLPVLVVQHMGAPFMEGFASWLGSQVPHRVTLAADGEMPVAGRVYVAPGDVHLTLRGNGTLRLGREAPVRSQRPSATMLFRSLARDLGGRAIGVILTGMGEDGAEGLVELRRAGGYVLAEHESTTVVNGMPAAAIKAGGVSAVLPLERIADRLRQVVSADGP